MHFVPVNPLHSVQPASQDVTVIWVAPTTQHTAPPPSKFAQSAGCRHSQSMVPDAQAVPADWHVDGIDAPCGVSQQC